MHEVSGKVFASYAGALAARGVAIEPLIADLGVPLEVLCDPERRLDWELLMELSDRIATRIGLDECIGFGRRTAPPDFEVLTASIVELVGPERAFGLLEWVPTHLLGVPRIAVRPSEGMVEIEVEVPAERRGSEAWLRIFLGGAESLPAAFGLRVAGIELAVESTRRARGRLALPPPTAVGAPGGEVAASLLDAFRHQAHALARSERDRERGRAEQARQAAVSQALLEAIDEGVAIVDGAALVVRWANPALARLLGADAGALVGTSLLAWLAPDGVEHLRAALAAPSIPGTIDVTLPGGAELELTLTDRRADEAIGGWIVSARDVTARNAAARDAQRAVRLESVGRLASGIAHDFNNYLTALVSLVAVIRRKLPMGRAIDDELTGLDEVTDKAAGLTRQLLAFARKQRVRPRAVDVSVLVAGIEGLLRQAVGSVVTLELALEPAPWTVEVDPGQLEQVLVNLAINARDAMPDGGTVRLATRNQADVDPAGGWVVIEVSDTGQGMSDEVAAQVFEPFFTTKGDLGTGLGLAICHGIVSQAGGHIDVHSRPGEGTTFAVHLPRAAPDPG